MKFGPTLLFKHLRLQHPFSAKNKNIHSKICVASKKFVGKEKTKKKNKCLVNFIIFLSIEYILISCIKIPRLINIVLFPFLFHGSAERTQKKPIYKETIY